MATKGEVVDVTKTKSHPSLYNPQRLLGKKLQKRSQMLVFAELFMNFLLLYCACQ
jgi:hypothetical protein